MARELILLTGSSGHVGYKILIEALSKGYNVRAAVRNEASITKVKSAKSTQPFLDQLTFVIIPDMTMDGAFDEAAQGSHYIVHVASPLPFPSDDDEHNIIRPAVKATLNILNAALQQPLIKKVIITSSVAAISPADNKELVTEHNTTEPIPGPYENPFDAYRAAKIIAYNATRQFIEEKKPHFAVVNIMPSFILGKHELMTKAQEIISGSNGVVLAGIVGNHIPVDTPPLVVHADDVAFVHIAALGPAVSGNDNFILNVNGKEGGIKWDDVFGVVKKHFPKEVEAGVFPNNGTLYGEPKFYDGTKAEEVFNFKYKTFEDQIVNVVEYYAEAVNRERS